jgi:transposase
MIKHYVNIAKKLGVNYITISNWLVKGRKYSTTGNIINPDAELEPRKIRGQKLDVKLLTNFIKDGYTDADIIELVADEKGPKIAGQVRDMLPVLRKKLNPGTQVIDKTRTGSMRDPDITGFVKETSQTN